MEEWYLRIAGTEYGPYSLEQLVQYIGEGRVSGDHGVRKAPSPDWMEARQVPELAHYFTSAAETSATKAKLEPPPAPGAKKARKKKFAAPAPFLDYFYPGAGLFNLHRRYQFALYHIIRRST